MATLLYIESSPRKKRSSSIQIANTFLQDYQTAHPKDEIARIDLWKKELPALDGDIIDAKYAIMNGETANDAQKKAWKGVESLIAEFKAADKYVISLPMWNFGIPYQLKHYIDLLVQPGYTFSFSPETGYTGLMTGKKMLVIYSRGGSYGAETGVEFLDNQKHYMETILGFIGFTNIESIVVEPTSRGPEVKEKALQSATEKAKKLASQF
jgi:FMN-dependent NADH-azoreductase